MHKLIGSNLVALESSRMYLLRGEIRSLIQRLKKKLMYDQERQILGSKIGPGTNIGPMVVLVLNMTTSAYH